VADSGDPISKQVVSQLVQQVVAQFPELAYKRTTIEEFCNLLA
jgi:hypothetical protein